MQSNLEMIFLENSSPVLLATGRRNRRYSMAGLEYGFYRNQHSGKRTLIFYGALSNPPFCFDFVYIIGFSERCQSDKKTAS